MNRKLPTLSAIVFAAIAASAAAQASTTDEARGIAAKQTTQQVQGTLFRAPRSENVAIGDYRAAAANATREVQYREMVADVLAHEKGERSQPLAVNSEDTARAEAQRVHHEQNLAHDVAVLQGSVQARVDLQQGLNASVAVR
jgi:hypothetical protein